jgi:hypothetical protein
MHFVDNSPNGFAFLFLIILSPVLPGYPIYPVLVHATRKGDKTSARIYESTASANFLWDITSICSSSTGLGEA